MRGVVKALGLTSLALAAPAEAHPEISPVATNRYVSIAAFERSLEVSYALLSGQLPGAEERRRMDADGDGALTPAELALEEARWAAEAGALVALAIDGRIARPAWKPGVELGGEARVGAFPLVVELRASLPLEPGRHTVRVEPGTEPARLGETEIAIDAMPGVRLDSAHRGTAGGLQGTRFKYLGPRTSAIEDRSVTFTVAPDPNAGRGGAGKDGRTPRAIGILVIAGVALGFAHALARRSEGRATHLALRALGHAAFPAAVGTLLAFARGRLLDGAVHAPTVDLLRWTAAAIAGLVALAPALSAARDIDAVTGHREATLSGLLVPSLTMIALAAAAAIQPPWLAPIAPIAFAAGASAAPSVPTAPWRPLRYVGACALVAAVLTA